MQQDLADAFACVISVAEQPAGTKTQLYFPILDLERSASVGRVVSGAANSPRRDEFVVLGEQLVVEATVEGAARATDRLLAPLQAHARSFGTSNKPAPRQSVFPPARRVFLLPSVLRTRL